MFNNLIKAVRQRVSADKRRFNMGEIDIDLTYITDRIIGTADHQSRFNRTAKITPYTDTNILIGYIITVKKYCGFILSEIVNFHFQAV